MVELRLVKGYCNYCLQLYASKEECTADHYYTETRSLNVGDTVDIDHSGDDYIIAKDVEQFVIDLHDKLEEFKKRQSKGEDK